MRTRTSHRPIAGWRALLVLAAFLGMVFDGMVPHDMAVDRSGGAASVEVSQSAVHPGDPAHIEQRAEMEVHPGCVACLLQMATRTVPGPAPLPLPPLTPGVRAVAPVTVASSQDSSLLGPARAPPASLLSA